MNHSVTFIFILFFLFPLHVQSQDSEGCDTTISYSLNGVLYNEYNLEKLFNNISFNSDSNKQIKDWSYQSFESEYYIFTDQYLLIAGLTGGGNCYYEVGYSNGVVKRNFKKNIKDKLHFITERGIYLGIKEKDFQKQISYDFLQNPAKFYLVRPNIRIGKSIYTVYYYQCDSNNEDKYEQQFAHLPRRPSYIARYVFCNSKLVKFSFGSLPYHPTLEFEDILY